MSCDETQLNNPNGYVDREDILARINAAFAAVVPNYDNDKKNVRDALKPLVAQIQARQAAGDDMTIADQMSREIGWLAKYTANWDRAKALVKALLLVLADPKTVADKQDDSGAWGNGCHEPYRKLEPTVDTLQAVAFDDRTLRPLEFMQRYLDADWTLDYLYRLQTTDIKANKVNYRDELGSAQSSLSQLIFKDGLRELFEARPALKFEIPYKLEATYRDYLEQTQHPRTGYWGPWYRFDDQLIRVQDLSFTFHVISYRAGNVSRWPLIIDTTLDIKELTYPAGWRPDPKVEYSNHNNYDVLTIFAYGWSYMDARQKVRVRNALQRMLIWCLTDSIDQTGFKAGEGLPSDAFYYGVRFLDKAGYWDPAKRFWLHRSPDLPANVPAPATLAQRLLKLFDKFKDDSAEARTTRSILRMAAVSDGGDVDEADTG